MSVLTATNNLNFFFGIVLIMFLVTQRSNAQVNLPLEASKIQLAYQNPPHLSFNVKFTNALESSPTIIEDSSAGIFKLSGNSYWGTLDSMELMQNSSYAIFLYKGNKIMNVNNPRTVYPSLANFSLFDSLLGKNNYTTNITASGINKIINLTFSDPGFPYKNYKLYYDSVTYLVSKIAYTIRDDFNDFSDSYNRSANGNMSDYVLVTAIYSNYSFLPFSITSFNTNNYFIYSNGFYIPQPPYAQYEVFLAAPNLYKNSNPAN